MIIDVQGHYTHGTAYEKTLSAWPTLQLAPAQVDTDNDGMPDAWEIAMGLNPNKANDHNYELSKLYTNIEMYLNSITP